MGGAGAAPSGAAAPRDRICRRGRTARYRGARGSASGEASDDGGHPGLPATRARVVRRAAVAVFTRLLVGLDGSPRADSAFEQAVVLAQRFGSTVVVAYVREHNGRSANGAAMLDRASERLATAGLRAELVEREGEPDVELAELAKAADAVLVGRRGVTTKGAALGPTVASLIRIAERCVLVCGGLPSPMTSCALAFDGRETSQRALELAVRFATVVGSTIHLIHAASDRDAGLQVVGVAEALLSMQRVPFVTHVEPGTPGEVVARVIKRTRCDALFAGAHLSHEHGRPSAVLVSHAEEILRHTDIPAVLQPGDARQDHADAPPRAR